MKLASMFLTLLMILSFGTAYAKDLVVEKSVDDLSVRMTLDKNPPVVGVNGIAVEIVDKDGKPLTDAEVAVNYSMPPMPGMPPMNYKAGTELKGDKYLAKLDISMSGSWNISVRMTRGGKTSTARFTIDAR